MMILSVQHIKEGMPAYLKVLLLLILSADLNQMHVRSVEIETGDNINNKQLITVTVHKDIFDNDINVRLLELENKLSRKIQELKSAVIEEVRKASYKSEELLPELISNISNTFSINEELLSTAIAENSYLSKKNGELQSQIEISTQNNKGLQERLMGENSKLSDSNKDLQVILGNLTITNRDLEAKVQDLQEKMANKSESNIKLEFEIQKKDVSIQELQGQFTEARQNINTLNESLHTLTGKYSNLAEGLEISEFPVNYCKIQQNTVLWKLVHNDSPYNIPSGGTVWKPSQSELEAGKMQLKYSTAQDTYFRVVTKQEIWGRDKGVYDQSDMFRMVEDYFKTTYLARNVGTAEGSISWKFDLSGTGRTIDNVRVIFSTTLFGGEVDANICTSAECEPIPRGASKYTPSRMAYTLARETLFLEDMRYSMLLPATDPYKNVTYTRKQKEKQIEEEFYSSDAMVNREWTRSNQPQRRAIIGLATHGFHHKMCKNNKYHQPSDICECKICEQKCERYHFKQCKRWTGSLNDLIKDKKVDLENRLLNKIQELKSDLIEEKSSSKFEKLLPELIGNISYISSKTQEILAHSIRENDQLSKRNKELQSNLEIFTQDNEELVNTIVNEYGRMSETKKDFLVKLGNLTIANQHFEEIVQKQEYKISNLTENNKDLEIKIKDRDVLIAELQGQLTEATNNIRNLKENLRTVTERYSNLKDDLGISDHPVNICKIQQNSVLWKLVHKGHEIQSTSGGTVWKPSISEQRIGIMQLQYSSAQDKYFRPVDKQEIRGWEMGVYRQSQFFRMVENDWKVAYLVRKGNGLFETRHFQGINQLEIVAKTTSGTAGASWHHAQLFRQLLNNTVSYGFDVSISFRKCDVTLL
ncbi:hypothetical protein C0J52_22208 [Blattella germanica]|nr:hypothetical protein C0J52_22208 [Blattella germanica]